MKKILLSIIFSGLFIILPLSAQVNVDELGGHGPVEFINYQGPYIRIDTRAQIRDIGSSLGVLIRAGATRAGATNRYFVINSRSEPDGNRMDADIFGLGVDAMVDHIRNLRLIIQGYLEAAYDYSESDAALLAQYITIYNAVYRGDLTFFETRYKRDVMSHLTRERAGLSIRFDEWPGQTLMLIPLGIPGLGGPLSSIDTGALSDPLVREQLRQEEDGGIEQRRDMVDLMEREADQAMETANIIREAIREEEDRIEQERQEAIRREEELARLEEEARQELASSDPEDEAEAQRRLDEIQRELDELRRTQEELDERQAALDALREEAERQEEFARERLDDAQEERREIADDQQALLTPTRTQDIETILGVIMTNQELGLGQLIRIDGNTGREIARSPINTVYIRSIIAVGNRVYFIAGEDTATSAIRLVEVNAQNLQLQRQGDDDISPSSLLWLNGQDFYAIVREGSGTYLARFNQNLILQTISSQTVHPGSTPLFYEGIITTQRVDGTVLLLNPVTLEEIEF